MAANDVPLFFFLDPGFLMFVAACGAGYLIWKVLGNFGR